MILIRDISSQKKVELAKLQVLENTRLANYLDEVFKAGNRAKEVFQQILGIRPNQPVILCTGYNPRINEDSAETMGVDALLLKPLTLRDMAVTVRKVLERRN